MSTATVVMVQGQAFVQGTDGSLRELRPGDVISDGERLVTSQGGEISISPGGVGDPVTLSGSGQVRLLPSTTEPAGPSLVDQGIVQISDDSAPIAAPATPLGSPVTAGAAVGIDAPVPEGTQANGTTDAELAALAQIAEQADNVLGDEELNELLAAIDSGEGDLFDDLEDPAAGGTGGGGDDEGSGFVRLLRIVETVDPLAFQFGLEGRDGPIERDFTGVDAVDPGDDDEGVTLTGLDGPEDPTGPGGPGNPGSPGGPGNPGNPGGPGGPGGPGQLPIGAAGAEQVLFEADLAGGSRGDATQLIRTGSFGFDSPDGLATLSVGPVSLTLAQLDALGTSPVTIVTDHGVVTLTGFTGSAAGGTVSYTYELTGNVDNDSVAGATDGGYLESLSVQAVDVDGSSASGSLDILIVDDAPRAEDDPTVETTDDTAVSINVITNATGADTLGGDGAELTAAELLDSTAGSLEFNADGTITFTPAAGFEGTAEIRYTLTDNDGDTSQATWRVEVEDDEPEIEINPESPNASGNNEADEAGLDDGGSQAATDLETTSGAINIDTGSDTLASLKIVDKDGTQVDVTNGGTVQGAYGTLTVTESNGDYSYSYTLADNTEDHTTQGTGTDDVKDEFALVIEDSDGDVNDSATLTIDIKDDVPEAKDDAAETDENQPITVNVLDGSAGGLDVGGADGPYTFLTDSVTLESGSGTITNVDANGNITFTPADGYEGDAVISYTIRDADGDTSTASLTITVDATPEVEVNPESPNASGNNEVDEAGLDDGGSQAATDLEITSGAINIDTGSDTLASLKIVDKDGTQVDVTNGGTVQGAYGTLTVTESNGDYSYSYTLADNTEDHTTQGTATDDVKDEFALVIEDSDGDVNDSATLTIDIKDDVPEAKDDAAETDENQPITVNVLDGTAGGLDVGGADGPYTFLTDSVTLESGSGTITNVDANGNITFTPADGYEGDAVISYTIRDADGDTSTASLTITVDATPEVEVNPESPNASGNNEVDEAGLDDGGSQAATDLEITSGAINIDTGSDTLASLKIVDKDGTQVDVTNGGTVQGAYGTLTVTESNGDYSYSYTLADNTEDHTSQGTATDDVKDDFALVIEDSDGDVNDSATLTIDIKDDVPEAKDDAAETDENQPITVNVLDGSAGGLDVAGADGPYTFVTDSVTLESGSGTITNVDANGNITFTPADGYEGDAVISYTIRDADGDTSTASLTITVDATPEVEVNPESPNASGNNEVDEAGLDDGGSQAATDLETTSGAINIDTGSDTLASLKIVDKDGTQVDVTNGGTVQGAYGTLTVTESNGDYSYSYTLADNTEDHTSQGTATDDVKDDFALVIEDSDGDVNDSATLTIDIKDDVPEAKDDAAETDENQPITVNVLDGTAGGLDVAGADGPYTFLTDSVTLESGSGTITNVDANGNITFTPADGYEGDAVISYTIRDADGDTSTASLTITVDATPEVEVNPESPNASGNSEVDEAGLDDGGSQAATDLEITSGAINIDTGSDTLASLKIVDKDGTQVDVTNGGTVQGAYGTLTVTESNGDYSYSYTLADNTEDHTSQGTGTDDVKDEFALVIEDSDGDVNDSATLTIDIKDDVPEAKDDAAETDENQPITVNVLDGSAGGLDVGGADGPYTFLTDSVTLESGSGTITNVDANGNITFTPADGYEGDAVISYTIRDADGDTSTASLTITVDATPEVEVNPESPNASGNNEVDEAGLDDGGSQAATDLEITSGAINIDTGSDTLASLKIVDKDGTQVDVTNGGTVQGAYGTLTVTESNGDYSYSYTLADNTEDHTSQGTATDDVKDDFALVIEDSDGDVNDSATLTIDIKDDVPEAKDDAAETDENQPITVNVLDGSAGGLDVAGADGPYTFVTDSVTLESGSGTITNVDANGNITFTPADGYEGDAVISYTIRDADGDTSTASLTITVDATPEVEVNPESPNASGNNEVDEAGLDDGGSQAATDLETTSGAINIDTGSDTLASLKIVDKDGTQVDVTNGGTVQGAYGTLTVTESNGDYSYSYTLADNTEDHTSQGTATDDVKDDFALVIEDSDGDVNDSATLTIDIKDDVPEAKDDAAETDENQPITVNVLDGTAGGLDVAGADGPYTFLTDSVTLESGSGTITNVDANGNITFTPADGYEGDAVISYTIRDADGDTSTASLTITVDATPEVEVNPESPNASGNNEVDEAGLDDGGSQAATDLEITSGAINIDTGSDSLASLKIVDKDGTQVDVTNGGTVQGAYGTLTVTESNGDYSYSYTLADNTEDHTSQGTGTDDVKDEFALVIEDSDGDVNDSATLTIDIKDDVPQLFSEAEHALESGSGSLDFGPNVGADGVGEVVFAAAFDGQPATDSQGNALRVDGKPLSYRLSADGTTLYAESADGAEDGFSVTLNAAGDGYSVEVIGEVTNGVDASAELADGELVTGGHLALNHTDGATDNDLLVSSDSGPVVVSGGQIAVATGTSIRIDALKDLSTSATGASWSDHQGLASFTQRVQVSGSEGATTALVIAALMYAADGSAGSGDPAAGSSDYLSLTTDDITVFNAIGVDVTSQVTLTLDGDGVRVEGLKDGWQVKLETGDARPFEAVEIEAADSATNVNDNLLLDDMEYRLGGPKEDFELELGLVGRDGDGDELTSTLTLKGDAPDQLLVGGNGEQSLEGGGGDDVIIGDAGGVLNEPADNYNVTLIIDSSGSMGNSSGNGGLSRLELAKQALEHLVEQLSEHEGTINLQIIDFDTAVTAGDSIVFNDFSAADLTAAIAFIEAMVAQGGTNYEDGFDTAREWFASQTNGYANIGFFLTDGVPTYYQNANGDRAGNGSSFTQTVMNESVNAFGELASIAQVAAIGMGNGINTNVLRFFDNTNTLGTASTNLSGNANDAINAEVGQPQIVNSGGDLDAALQEAAASLIPTGADSLSGGGGDDILVADTLNSDDLAWTNADSGEDFNAGAHDGLGYGGLYAYLTWTKVDPNGSGVADRVDDPDGTAPTDEEVREYIRAEIDNLTDDRADGSANTLDGGEGDDLLIGGAGADNLLGGVGDDILIGGAGNDTLDGGAGNDIIDLGTGADVVAWNDGDAGTSAAPANDEINDFTLGDVSSDAEADRLEMADLLDGATEASVNDYLYAEEDGSGNTVLYVKSDGGIGTGGNDADQVITLNGVDMGGQDSATFLQQMIDDGQLQVE